MNKSLLVLLTVTTTLFATWSSAQELTIGSNAPKLDVKEFVKGEPVKSFEKGKTYVVEFWATWCGPCRTSIPHLTKLQKQHKDLTIIGVAVLEQDQIAVTDFVEEMGDKMDYRVAIDKVPEGGEGDEGAMVKTWMEPAEQPGIPFAVIVNGDGKVAWIGHPGEMDDTLEKVLTGKWDIAAEALKLKEIIAQRKKLEAKFKQLQTLLGKFESEGDPSELLKELDIAAKEIPDRADQFSMIKFHVLSNSKENVEQALTLGNKLLESELGEDSEILNNLAWMLVAPDREKKADAKLLKFALKAALKADNLEKREDASIADTLAKAYFDNGQLEKAIETQERVVELAEGTQLESDPGVKKRLRQYKRALETKKTEAAPKSATPKKE
jgi:thiol-disulfide isomerase/thioredoxin